MKYSTLSISQPVHHEKSLSLEARRALTEASERRLAETTKGVGSGQLTEIQGRGGLDPVRYQDWEVKGIASDF